MTNPKELYIKGSGVIIATGAGFIASGAIQTVDYVHHPTWDGVFGVLLPLAAGGVAVYNAWESIDQLDSSPSNREVKSVFFSAMIYGLLLAAGQVFPVILSDQPSNAFVTAAEIALVVGGVIATVYSLRKWQSIPVNEDDD